MSAVVVATSPGDVRALEVVKNHHARLASALIGLVEAIRPAATPVHAAANAQALRSLFESHWVKEDKQILPLLAESSEDSPAVILEDMHHLLGGPVHSEYAEAAAECGCGGECGCGHQHPVDLDTPRENPAR